MPCSVVMTFTVDPQDEAERKEERLAIIADHLGFSWTGEWVSGPHDLIGVLRIVIGLE